MVLARNTNSRLQVDEVGDVCAPAEVLGVSPGIGGLDSCSHKLQRNGQEHLDFPNGDDDDPDDDHDDNHDDDHDDDHDDEFEDDEFEDDEFNDTDDEEDIDEDIDDDIDDDNDFVDDDF